MTCNLSNDAVDFAEDLAHCVPCPLKEISCQGTGVKEEVLYGHETDAQVMEVQEGR